MGNLCEVLDGLKGDEILAASNLTMLATGVPVKIAQAGGMDQPENDGRPCSRRRKRRKQAGRPAMKLADVSIRRPVFAFMMSAAIVVLGIASYSQLGLDLMPKTDFPMVVVRTSLPGASAEEIETQITKPIEEVVNTIAGIDELRSSSQQGSSRVMITFVLEREIEDAVQDVRDKVSTITNQFPQDTLPPVIQKMDPDANPILTIAVSGDRSQKEISQIVDKQIKQVLETVQNVGEVIVHRRPASGNPAAAERGSDERLWSDRRSGPQRRSETECGNPRRKFSAGPSEIALRTMGRIQNVEDFNKIIIAYSGGSVITFGDIGRVLDTVEEPRSVSPAERPRSGFAQYPQAVRNQYRRSGGWRHGAA